MAATLNRIQGRTPNMLGSPFVESTVPPLEDIEEARRFQSFSFPRKPDQQHGHHLPQGSTSQWSQPPTGLIRWEPGAATPNRSGSPTSIGVLTHLRIGIANASREFFVPDASNASLPVDVEDTHRSAQPLPQTPTPKDGRRVPAKRTAHTRQDSNYAAHPLALEPPGRIESPSMAGSTETFPARLEGRTARFGDVVRRVDEMDGAWKGAERRRQRMRALWMLVTVVWVFVYGMLQLFACLKWGVDASGSANVIRLFNQNTLIYLGFSTALCLLASGIGTAARWKQSRGLAFVYILLLIFALLCLLILCFTVYRRRLGRLDEALDAAYGNLSDGSMRRVQNSLQCCGYNNALGQAIHSTRCHPQSRLPSCQTALFGLEESFLGWCGLLALILMPIHCAVLGVAVWWFLALDRLIPSRGGQSKGLALSDSDWYTRLPSSAGVSGLGFAH